jgi:S-adenosylmethionine decarboxylase
LFFEGSEKKVEVTLSDINYSLINDLPDSFWYELISCSDAKILSKIQNDQCKAFILSESSLFVWHNRFVILTCGVTHLVNSVEFFIQKMGEQSIAYLTYQRKNEYYSQAQPSCFGDDVKRLNSYIKGNALRFGEMDSHHTFLFYQEEVTQRKRSNQSYEFLAYQISDNASNQLTRRNLPHHEIREFLQLDELLKGFEIDDHVFEPYGYSVNAIKGNRYITIHVTPQAESSYVSVESNINLSYLIPTFLQVLAPKSFDLLCFNDDSFERDIKKQIDTQYISKSLVQQYLKNDTFVSFSNYILPKTEYSKATEFDIDKVHHEL